MKTFATLATSGTFQGTAAGEVLVGRLVANAEFLRALFSYSSFERFALFCGENPLFPSANRGGKKPESSRARERAPLPGRRESRQNPV